MNKKTIAITGILFLIVAIGVGAIVYLQNKEENIEYTETSSSVQDDVVLQQLGGNLIYENISQSEDVRLLVTDEGFSISKWDGEASFNVDLHDAVDISGQNGIINLSFSWFDAQMYMSKENVFQFDGILDKKPNPQYKQIDLPLNLTNMTCYLQQALDKEQDPEVWSCNATDCTNIEDEQLNRTIIRTIHRPMDVVDSYACYIDGKANNEYKTGKIFHIKRIKFIDADNNTMWSNMSITNDTWSIILPTEWLKTASYPVLIDPGFGYSTEGGSDVGTGSIWNYATKNSGDHYTASSGDTVTDLYAYVDPPSSGSMAMAIYDVSGGVPNNLILDSGTVAFSGANLQWWHTTVSQALSAGTTYAVAQGDYQGAGVYYFQFDTVSSSGSEDTVNGAGFADPWGDEYTDSWHISMYANYTTGGGGGDCWTEETGKISIPSGCVYAIDASTGYT